MRRNLGRQAYRAVEGAKHRKLDSDIADTRSLLNTSAQTMKDLKAQLKGLTDKKKEAGGWRNSQTGTNIFNIPIPKINGAAAAGATLTAEMDYISTPTPDNTDSDVEMQRITLVDIRGNSTAAIETAYETAPISNDNSINEDTEMEVVPSLPTVYVQGASTIVETTTSTPTADEIHEIAPGPANVPLLTYELPIFQPGPPVPPTGLGEKVNNEEAGIMYTSHPGFELPPLDLELFNAALETDPIPEPTAAEVAAYLFLRSLQVKK